MEAPPTEQRPGKSGSSGTHPDAAVAPSEQARSAEATVAIAIIAIVAAVFVWWAWKDGAYFGEVFFPGAIILFGLLILLLIAGPFRGRVSGPAGVALAALVALAAWTLLSIAWTNSQDSAVQDAERAILYAAVFALGLWTCNLSGRRALLPLAAVAATGIVIGIVITITLAGGTDISTIFHDDATLRFPIGYRNAEAAFLLVCLWPLIALAAEEEFPWQLRALLVGGATMLLELVVLAQSRGSLPAAAVGLAVLIVLMPRRLRVAAYLTMAVVPVLPALPTLLDVFQHGQTDQGLIPLMHDSARAIAITSLASIVLAAVCIRGIEFRLHLGPERIALISRIAAVLAIATVVVGGTVFVAKRGGPIDFVDQRLTEFRQVGYPDLSKQGARFGANVGSNRHDFWRVALDEGADSPLQGGGAGSFQIAYLQDRKSTESPNDPHSVEMLMFSELGVVGLLLFGTFVVASGWAGLRSRRAGAAAAVLVAASLAAGANWLVHSSYDWFWHYPGLTAPVMFLLGAAAAPALRNGAQGLGGRGRWAATGVFGVALLIALPLFMSQRYANQAQDEFPDDPAAALSDFGRAADLDPYDPQPLLARGVIESEIGRDQEAVATFREAVDREPDEYATHYFLARELAASDPAAARVEAEEALRLNPLDLKTRALARRLERQRGP